MENDQEIKSQCSEDYLEDSVIEEAYNNYCKIKAETGVKSQCLADYLDKDPSLKIKMTYEEFTGSIKAGIDDSGVEEAFNNYCKLIAEMEKNLNVLKII